MRVPAYKQALAWFQSCLAPKGEIPEHSYNFTQMCGIEEKERMGDA